MKFNFFSTDHLIKRNNPFTDKHFVGIISTGRTGTKFFSKLFNQYFPELIDAVHEPKLDLTYSLQDVVSGKLKGNEKTLYLAKGRKELLSQLNKNLYLESNGALAFYIPDIIKLSKSYKILHIVRNGKEWVRSALSRTEMVDNKLSQRYLDESNWKFTGLDVIDPSYHEPNWNNLDLFEKFCWVWNYKNRLIIDQAKTNPNILTCKFEDIFASNKDQMTQLARIINFTLEGSGEKNQMLNLFTTRKSKIDILLKTPINSTNEFLFPAINDWEPEYLEKFDRICGDLMRELKYE